MTKKIGGFYNGGTESYRYCDNPVEAGLKKGHYYYFTGKRDLGFQTNVGLKGFPNLEFNSVWFNEQEEFPTTYLAISEETPIVGDCLFCQRFVSGRFSPIKTSPVTEVITIGKDTFEVMTKNSIYVVQVSPHNT